MAAAPGNLTVTPCLGSDVAKAVLQWIGAFRSLHEATIISYNMQDYEFWGNGRLSRLLLRQLALGARIIVMTTPPPGKSGRQLGFRRKLTLLEALAHNGAEVYLHDRLHVKAYLFRDVANSEMLIVGSPNLTTGGFGTRTSTNTDWLELALLTEDHLIYSSTSKLIKTAILHDPDTIDFGTWAALNRTEIAVARGAI